MRGVQVGKVASIESQPDGTAALHLAMDPVAAASHPVQRARRHRVVDGVRRQVRAVDAAGEPLGAETARGTGDSEPARHGRDQHGLPATRRGAGQDRPRQAQPDPRRDRDGVQRPRREDRQDADRLQRASWPRSNRACRTSATTSRPLCRRSTRTPMRRPISFDTSRTRRTLSNSIVDEQQNLDEFLVSSIGLADIGNDVVGGNRQALTDVLHLLVPTTDLLNRYHEALGCGIGGSRHLHAQAPRCTARHRGVGRSHARRRAISLSGGPAEGRRQGRPVLQGTRPARRATRGSGRRSSSLMSAPTP